MYYFVGERPSRTALEKGWRWEDGRLAAKQLFDALRAAGVDPACCRFTNLFESTLGPRARVRKNARRAALRALCRGETVVALGALVAERLGRMGVPHVRLVHPAARGKIRTKALYCRHVRERLPAAAARRVTSPLSRGVETRVHAGNT